MSNENLNETSESSDLSPKGMHMPDLKSLLNQNKDHKIGPQLTSIEIPTLKNPSEKLDKYILKIQEHLIETHAAVLGWFNEPEEIKQYRPKSGGWTIIEILEHITLTSHYLLILIEKGAKKALKNIHNLELEEEVENYHFDLSRIDPIGVHQSFDWIRPEHMEPTGEVEEFKIKIVVMGELSRCLNLLRILEGGAGLLYKTTMTVNDLGKLNVYEYIYFLSKHAERHIQQMEKNKQEFRRG